MVTPIKGKSEDRGLFQRPIVEGLVKEVDRLNSTNKIKEVWIGMLQEKIRQLESQVQRFKVRADGFEREVEVLKAEVVDQKFKTTLITIHRDDLADELDQLKYESDLRALLSDS